jgi:hypothetical protein
MWSCQGVKTTRFLLGHWSWMSAWPMITMDVQLIQTEHPIVFMSVVVNTSGFLGRVASMMTLSVCFYAYREASILTGELPRNLISFAFFRFKVVHSVFGSSKGWIHNKCRNRLVQPNVEKSVRVQDNLDLRNRTDSQTNKVRTIQIQWRWLWHHHFAPRATPIEWVVGFSWTHNEECIETVSMYKYSIYWNCQNIHVSVEDKSSSIYLL